MTQRLAFASLSALAIAALPAAAEVRNYDVGNFDGIDASAGIKVYFETGNSRAVRVENSEGDFSDIRVEVDDEELVLTRNQRNNGKKNRPSYTVTVITPSISEVSASSGAYMEGSGLSGDDTEVEISSSARVILTNVSTGEIDIEASSAGSLDISGSCAELDIEASSGASVDASELQCAAVDAEVTSGASIRAHASDRVDAEATSGGSVRVTGGATDVTIDKSSGGSISVG